MSTPHDQPDIRQATEADLAAVADVLSVSFVDEYASLFTRDEETRRRCVEAMLSSDFLAWRDSTLVCRVDEKIVGVVVLCWTPRLTRRPAWRCLRGLAGVIGWLRALVAMASLQLSPEPRPGRGACEMLIVAVLPTYRQRGIARRLIAAAEQGAQARCRSWLSVAVNERNAPAIALYQSCGFERTRTCIVTAELLLLHVSRYHRMQKPVDLSWWLDASLRQADG
jgi:ribosomal protein S18 acetylase RimI-like enzyme